MPSSLPPKVFLAGRVAVETDGVLIDEARFPGRQGRLLFAYLVAENGRAVPREELAEALWGGAPPATWEKALTVLVSKLRALLADNGVDGTDALTAAFGCYRLDLPDGAWVDVIAASDAERDSETALAAGDLEQAAAAATLATSLVRQPFLPGEEGEWVEEKRRELADVRSRALTTLVDVCMRSGNPHEATKWAEQAIALEPFRESGYRRLMDAHIAAGNRAEALRVYERCRRLLSVELGAYPSPETEAIYRDLLEAPAAPHPPPAAGTTEFAAPTRSRSRIVVGSLACVVAAAGVALLVAMLRRDPTPVHVVPNSLAVIDARSNRIVASTPVGVRPSQVASGAGSIWVINVEDSTLSRIDSATHTLQRTIALPATPTGVAFGEASVWVASGPGGTVSRVDPSLDRVVDTRHVAVIAGEGGSIDVGRGSVWAVFSDSTLHRLHSRTLREQASAIVGIAPSAVRFAGDTVLVANATDNDVMRVATDTTTVQPPTFTPGRHPVAIAIGASSVWVANYADDTIARIDPTTGSVTTIPVGDGPNAVAFGDGAIWVTNALEGTVSRIDPAGRRVDATIRVGYRPSGIAVARGRVWVSVQSPT